MGVFRYEIEIAKSPDGPFSAVQAVVDTGAFYTWVPASVLQDLEVEPEFTQQFKIADGTTIERGVAEVVVRLDGRTMHTRCVFGDEGSEPLLGAYTLEGFAVAPDPVNKKFQPLETLPLLVTQLATKHCVPCEGGTKPLERAVAESYHTVTPEWDLVLDEPNKLTRKFKFKDFARAMQFINRVADVAEAEGHHPDFSVSWNRVSMELTTHAIGGLSENDFIMAAKINDLEGGGRA